MTILDVDKSKKSGVFFIDFHKTGKGYKMIELDFDYSGGAENKNFYCRIGNRLSISRSDPIKALKLFAKSDGYRLQLEERVKNKIESLSSANDEQTKSVKLGYTLS